MKSLSSTTSSSNYSREILIVDSYPCRPPYTSLNIALLSLLTSIIKKKRGQRYIRRLFIKGYYCTEPGVCLGAVGAVVMLDTLLPFATKASKIVQTAAAPVFSTNNTCDVRDTSPTDPITLGDT